MYPDVPVLIQVKNHPIKVIANDVEVYELSVGITSFSRNLQRLLDVETFLGVMDG